MYAATKGSVPGVSDTASCTPLARPACDAMRGNTSGFGSTQRPVQFSTFSKYPADEHRPRNMSCGGCAKERPEGWAAHRCLST